MQEEVMSVRLRPQPDVQATPSVWTRSVGCQILGLGLVGSLERVAQEPHVINGPYQVAVALGS